MLVFVLAVLAASANATSSVLQRVANRQVPWQEHGPRLVLALVRRPVWLAGIGAITAGFLLQAAALSRGALAVVEPVLILELPIALLVASAVFRGRLRRGECVAVSAITAGLAGLLFFLSPSPAARSHVSGRMWAVGVTANLAVIGTLTLAARTGGCTRRAALLGVAAGSGFGLAAALMKAMTDTLNGGFEQVLLAWQTYAMIAAGLLGMLLLQGALHAGSLVAAQPGVTGADPVVSVLWGVLAFGEHVRTGVFLALAAGSALVIVAGIIELARSPLLTAAAAAPLPSQPGARTAR